MPFGSYNTTEDVIAHGNEDTGIQITVRSGNAGDGAFGAYNKVINCDSYENFDQATEGESADGFAAKERIGPGNEFRGCRAWNNADKNSNVGSKNKEKASSRKGDLAEKKRRWNRANLRGRLAENAAAKACPVFLWGDRGFFRSLTR
jgi:hypothetical protein